MNKRILSFILAAAILVSSMASCSDNSTGKTEEDEADAPKQESQQTEPETEESDVDTVEKFKSSYGGIDYEGYNFRILDRGSGDWKTFDVYAEETSGEPVNDAVYTRNDILENTINIKIVEVPVDSPAGDMKNSIVSQSDDYDTFTDGLSSVAPLVQQKYLLNMRDINSIDLDNEWWDQAMYEQISIGGGTYFMTGEISVMDNYGTWCYLFNKQLINDLNLENPYELVDSGKWTLDKHNEMASAAQNDTDGDGKWTMEDTYGFITETYNNIALWAGFGFRIAERDENDMPKYTYSGEEQLSALANIVDMQYSDFTNMGTNSTVNLGGSFTANTRENQFAIGRALFYYAGFRNVTLFRESDVDFGIIPAPKYNEEQSQYYSSYSSSNCTAYGIPVTVKDQEKIGNIMELMSELGMYVLTPAYYEKTLIGKSTRDSESEAMIDLIFKTRNFDLGIIFDLGNVYSTIVNMTSSDSIASSFKKIEKAANKSLVKFIEKFEETE